MLVAVCGAKDKERQWKAGILVDAASESRSYVYSAPVTGKVDDSGNVNLYGGTHSGNGRHHEIYLSDPRRVAPEKLKTILRMPVAAHST